MISVDTLMAAMRSLAEAMISLRGHVSFNHDQNAALERVCELIVLMEIGDDTSAAP
jgi:hypothetical protein